MMMEQLVQEQQQGGRIETVIIRPTWYYGPHQPPRQTLFFKMVRDGKAPIVGNGENATDAGLDVEHLLVQESIAEVEQDALGTCYHARIALSP